MKQISKILSIALFVSGSLTIAQRPSIAAEDTAKAKTAVTFVLPVRVKNERFMSVMTDRVKQLVGNLGGSITKEDAKDKRTVIFSISLKEAPPMPAGLKPNVGLITGRLKAVFQSLPGVVNSNVHSVKLSEPAKDAKAKAGKKTMKFPFQMIVGGALDAPALKELSNHVTFERDPKVPGGITVTGLKKGAPADINELKAKLGKSLGTTITVPGSEKPVRVIILDPAKGKVAKAIDPKTRSIVIPSEIDTEVEVKGERTTLPDEIPAPVVKVEKKVEKVIDTTIAAPVGEVKKEKEYVYDENGILVSVDGEPVPPGVQRPKLEVKTKDVPLPEGLKTFDASPDLQEFQKSLVTGDDKVTGLSEDYARAAWMLKQVGWKKRTFMGTEAARDALKGIDTPWAKKMRKASNSALKKMLKDESVRDQLVGHYMQYINTYMTKRLKKKGLDFEELYGPADRARILAAAYTEGMGRVSKKILKGGEGYEYAATTKVGKQIVSAFDKSQKKLATDLQWGQTIEGMRTEHQAAVDKEKATATVAAKEQFTIDIAKYNDDARRKMSLNPEVFRPIDTTKYRWPSKERAANTPLAPVRVKTRRATFLDGKIDTAIASIPKGSDAVAVPVKLADNMPAVVAGAQLVEVGSKVTLVPAGDKSTSKIVDAKGQKYEYVRDGVTPIVYMPLSWAKTNNMKAGDHMTVYQKGGKMVTAIYMLAPKGSETPIMSYAVSNTLGLKTGVSGAQFLYVGHPGSSDAYLHKNLIPVVHADPGYIQTKGRWLIGKSCMNRVCAPAVKREPRS